jgi:hypothetical protein
MKDGAIINIEGIPFSDLMKLSPMFYTNKETKTKQVYYVLDNYEMIILKSHYTQNEKGDTSEIFTQNVVNLMVLNRQQLQEYHQQYASCLNASLDMRMLLYASLYSRLGLSFSRETGISIDELYQRIPFVAITNHNKTKRNHIIKKNMVAGTTEYLIESTTLHMLVPIGKSKLSPIGDPLYLLQNNASEIISSYTNSEALITYLAEKYPQIVVHLYRTGNLTMSKALTKGIIKYLSINKPKQALFDEILLMGGVVNSASEMKQLVKDALFKNKIYVFAYLSTTSPGINTVIDVRSRQASYNVISILYKELREFITENPTLPTSQKKEIVDNAMEMLELLMCQEYARLHNNAVFSFDKFITYMDVNSILVFNNRHLLSREYVSGPKIEMKPVSKENAHNSIILMMERTSIPKNELYEGSIYIYANPTPAGVPMGSNGFSRVQREIIIEGSDYIDLLEKHTLLSLIYTEEVAFSERELSFIQQLKQYFNKKEFIISQEKTTIYLDNLKDNVLLAVYEALQKEESTSSSTSSESEDSNEEEEEEEESDSGSDNDNDSDSDSDEKSEAGVAKAAKCSNTITLRDKKKKASASEMKRVESEDDFPFQREWGEPKPEPEPKKGRVVHSFLARDESSSDSDSDSDSDDSSEGESEGGNGNPVSPSVPSSPPQPPSLPPPPLPDFTSQNINSSYISVIPLDVLSQLMNREGSPDISIFGKDLLSNNLIIDILDIVKRREDIAEVDDMIRMLEMEDMELRNSLEAEVNDAVSRKGTLRGIARDMVDMDIGNAIKRCKEHEASYKSLKDEKQNMKKYIIREIERKATQVIEEIYRSNMLHIISRRNAVRKICNDIQVKLSNKSFAEIVKSRELKELVEKQKELSSIISLGFKVEKALISMMRVRYDFISTKKESYTYLMNEYRNSYVEKITRAIISFRNNEHEILTTYKLSTKTMIKLEHIQYNSNQDAQLRIPSYELVRKLNPYYFILNNNIIPSLIDSEGKAKYKDLELSRSEIALIIILFRHNYTRKLAIEMIAILELALRAKNNQSRRKAHMRFLRMYMNRLTRRIEPFLSGNTQGIKEEMLVRLMSFPDERYNFALIYTEPFTKIATVNKKTLLWLITIFITQNAEFGRIENKIAQINQNQNYRAPKIKDREMKEYITELNNRAFNNRYENDDD